MHHPGMVRGWGMRCLVPSPEGGRGSPLVPWMPVVPLGPAAVRS